MLVGPLSVAHRRGNLPAMTATWEGDEHAQPIPDVGVDDPLALPAPWVGGSHAGHLGVQLEDDDGEHPGVCGWTWWLCLEHNEPVLTRRV
jgi:hypothetical protein